MEDIETGKKRFWSLYHTVLRMETTKKSIIEDRIPDKKNRKQTHIIYFK
jgi:hypothetical protein